MKARRLAHLFPVALLLAAVLTSAPVQACEAYPITEHSPTGVVNCIRYGEGTASMWGGPGIARNDCVYPWTACTPIVITSLDTGRSITVTPSMYGDLYLGDSDPANDRIVDLDPASVAALGLDPSRGLWPVTVAPAGAPMLPDTSAGAQW